MSDTGTSVRPDLEVEPLDEAADELEAYPFDLPTHAQAKERYEGLQARAQRMEGQRTAVNAQVEHLSARVAAAKTRLAASDEVTAVLQKLQERAHSRSVGVFEVLLSAILKDVLPDEGAIKLELDMKGNAPSLGVSLSKNGNLCDVLDATGGAVTNVVCTGLRFAALARSQNRRFMVLDEPDCWLKPERVPSFMKVLADVAAQTGVQTIFVSHHDPEFFGGGISLVKLARNDEGKVVASAMQPVASNWIDDKVPGIRALELVNFMAHEHTVVPFFPGATALVGDNNLGKSAALVSALKAVAFGESSDQVIRHGQTASKVVVYLEDDKRVVWTRELKRNPVVLFELWQGDKKLQESKAPARNSAPDWVAKELGIFRVSGLDLQVGSQKSPVFLLNETASTRAQILSLGREGSHVLSLMQSYDELKRADRDKVRNEEPEVQRLQAARRQMESIDLANKALAKGFKPLRRLDTLHLQVAALEKVLTYLDAAHEKVSRVEVAYKEVKPLPAAVKVEDDSDLQKLIVRMEQGERKVPLLEQLPVLPAPVEVADTRELEDLITRFARSEKAVALLEGIRLSKLDTPALADDRELEALVSRFQASEKAVAAAEQELALASRQHQAAQQAYDELIASLGGHCPLCGAVQHSHEHANEHRDTKND